MKDLPNITKYLPLFRCGRVVKGFGRGSKQLGIPTANYENELVDTLPPEFSTGVYYGWANIDAGPVYRMVMSVGWNPFYGNKKKTMETHILHQFDNDFYSSVLRVAIVGFIRHEENFENVDSLISAIKEDIRIANEHLDRPEHLHLSDHDYFKEQA